MDDDDEGYEGRVDVARQDCHCFRVEAQPGAVVPPAPKLRPAGPSLNAPANYTPHLNQPFRGADS
jgi:hypothetical protein